MQPDDLRSFLTAVFLVAASVAALGGLSMKLRIKDRFKELGIHMQSSVMSRGIKGIDFWGEVERLQVTADDPEIRRLVKLNRALWAVAVVLFLLMMLTRLGS